MNRSYEYTVLDVFAERALEGNPLAVFHDARGLSDAEMQALARETRLSETTFVLPAEDERGGVRVRIFTTEEELPFAGHPTLGTATWLYLHHSRLRGSQEITLALNVGPITVRFASAQAGPGVSGTMRQNDPEFRVRLNISEVAEVMGLPVEALDEAHPPQIVSTGNAFALVLLRDLAALERLAIPQQEATAWLRAHGGRWFYVLAPDGPHRFRARMQFNGGEDPATGSAAGPAIAWLLAEGLISPDTDCKLFQGAEMLRPSLLVGRASRDGNRIHSVDISGRTIPVATGRYFLPSSGGFPQGVEP